MWAHRSLVMLAIVLLSYPHQAFASGAESESGDSSNASGESSNDSDASSKQSDGSSDDSGGSSENSSQDSSKESSRGSSEATSDSSKKDNVSAALAIAAILVTAATTVGSIGASVASTTHDEQKSAELRLERFLKRNHPAVAHDIVLADGPVLDGFAAELGLTNGESTLLKRTLEGSNAQTRLLESIAGTIDRSRARMFAHEFTTLAQTALGEPRMQLAAARVFGK